MRRRAFWLVALVVALAIMQTPMPARADTVPGYPTAGCQGTGWTAYSTPWVAGLSAITIRFHLWISGGTGATSVQGRWESAGRVWSGAVWRSEHSGGDSFWIDEAGYGSVKLIPGPPPEGGGWLRYGLAVVAGPGCFVVDQVTVTRWANTGGDPAPTTTPAATGAVPSSSPGPSASPVAGWCPVYNGGDWVWVPCATAPPTATPSASPPPSGVPGSCEGLTAYTGYGTFAWDTGTGMPYGCLLWWGRVQSSGTMTYTFGAGFDVYRISTVAGIAQVRSADPLDGTEPDGCWGGCTSLGSWSGSYPQWVTGYATETGVNKTVLANEYVSVWLMAGGLDGTLTVNGPSAYATPSPPPATPTPTPSPDPSAVAFCEANPGSWLCASAPPGWVTPPPALPDDGGWIPVDICPPGTDILACSTWPPSPAPASPDVAGDAVAQLIADAREHSPFGELGQVGDALTEGLDNAAGGAVDYCFTLPWWTPIGTQNIESCLPMEVVAGWASSVRGILLAAFVLAFGVVVLRRVTENV